MTGMKKFLTSCLMLLTGSISCLGMSAYDFSVDNIFYKFVGDGVYVTYGEYDIIPWGYRPSEIVPYQDNYKGNVIIPSSVTYNGLNYAVTGIDERSFYDCPSLTSVHIPNTVTEIGNETFKWCSGLSSVEIYGSVNKFGSEMFVGCTKLESFFGDYASEGNRLLVVDDEIIASATCGLESYAIPDGIKAIREYAFYGSGLITIDIPESVRFIGKNAFYASSSLATIKIPDSVTEIDDSAFVSCENLKSVELPAYIDKLSNDVFYNCMSLESIEIPPTVKSIGRNALCKCRNLTDIALPNSVSEIQWGAFENCTSLETVVLPGGLEGIGDEAFSGCLSLSKITLHVDVPRHIKLGDNIFSSEIYNDCQLFVPSGSLDKYRNAPAWKNFRNIIELSSGAAPVIDDTSESCDDFTDISGVVVSKPEKGKIYIRNGKKVMGH